MYVGHKVLSAFRVFIGERKTSESQQKNEPQRNESPSLQSRCLVIHRPRWDSRLSWPRLARLGWWCGRFVRCPTVNIVRSGLIGRVYGRQLLTCDYCCCCCCCCTSTPMPSFIIITIVVSASLRRLHTRHCLSLSRPHGARRV